MIRIKATIHCDAEGCSAKGMPGVGTANSSKEMDEKIREVVVKAASVGWKSTDDLWFCPSCAKQRNL